MQEHENFIAKCEQWGEPQVRVMLAGTALGAQKKRWAEDWLTQKSDSRANAVTAEQTELSRRSAEAAEAQAKSARRANLIALAALGISVLALVVALLKN